jgi:FKBP-type peptidyl-prolyl cis-trans isomerase 2
VALSNGNAAVIREMNEDAGFVMVDSNHPFAGAPLNLTLKLVAIEDNPDDDETDA